MRLGWNAGASGRSKCTPSHPRTMPSSSATTCSRCQAMGRTNACRAITVGRLAQRPLSQHGARSSAPQKCSRTSPGKHPRWIMSLCTCWFLLPVCKLVNLERGVGEHVGPVHRCAALRSRSSSPPPLLSTPTRSSHLAAWALAAARRRELQPPTGPPMGLPWATLSPAPRLQT